MIGFSNYIPRSPLGPHLQYGVAMEPRRLTLPIALALLLFVPVVNAQVYRCTDSDGQLKFSDQPCEEQESEERLDIPTADEELDNRPVLPPNAGEMLREAARRGDTAQIMQLIDLGIDVNDRNSRGVSALHLAGHRLGLLQVVETLVMRVRPILESRAESSSAAIRFILLESLRKLRDVSPVARRLVVRSLKDPESRVRASAVGFLPRLNLRQGDMTCFSKQVPQDMHK